MTLSKYISIILFLFLITACRKEEISLHDVDFPSVGSKYAIVVEGGIFSELDLQFVRLTKPGRWAEASPLAEGIGDAEVYIQEGEHIYSFAPGEKPGDYFSVDSIRGEVGKTYTLVVSYEGKTYTATDRMVEGPEPTNRIPVEEGSIAYFTDSFTHKEKVQFSVYAHAFGYDVAQKWFLKSDLYDLGGTSLFNDLSRWHFNHQGSPPQGVFPSGQRLSCCGGIITDSEVEFISLSMSDKYYQYLVSLFNETEWAAGLFSVIPGNIKTNVSEGGTGFFYASEVKRATYKVEELEFY